MKYKVAVVDDHVLLSSAIGEMINGFESFECLFSCGNGKELLTKLTNPLNAVDIVLMDVKMPVMDGVEATAALAEMHPQIKVVALSMEDGEETIIKMLRAGAKGYLLKDSKKEILEKALLEVIDYGFYYTNEVSKILMSQLNGETTPESLLSDRELEFVGYACTDLTYKEIAAKMFLSPKTIDNYRDSVFHKLEVKNRVGLVLYAIKNQLVTLE